MLEGDGVQPRVTWNVNLPTNCGSGSKAGQALPTGQTTVITSHTLPANAPSHQCAEPLGASTACTVRPTFGAAAVTAAFDWQAPRAGPEAVIR